MNLKQLTAHTARTVLDTDNEKDRMKSIVSCLGNYDVLDYIDDVFANSDIPSLTAETAVVDFYKLNHKEILKTLTEAKNSRQSFFHYVDTYEAEHPYDMLSQIKDAVAYDIAKRIITTAIEKRKTDGIEFHVPLQKGGFSKSFETGISISIVNQNGIRFFFDIVQGIAKEPQEIKPIVVQDKNSAHSSLGSVN